MVNANFRINDDGVLEQKCNKHHLNFPDENPWMPFNTDYFYKHNTCKTGLFPTCIRCWGIKTDKWQKDNPEAKRISKKKYDAKDERVLIRREYATELRKTDYHKKYYHANSDQFKQYNYQHTNHRITKEEWIACKQYFNNCCAYCGLPIEDHIGKYNGKVKQRDFQKDHFYHDGGNQLNNCIPSCKKCNTRKWQFDFEEWYKKQPFYSKERYNCIIQWLTEDCYQYMKFE
jgi:hypothetical protein